MHNRVRYTPAMRITLCLIGVLTFALLPACESHQPVTSESRPVVYHRATLSTIIDAPAHRVTEAAERVVERWQLDQRYTDEGDNHQTVYAHTPDDQRIAITSVPRSPRTTDLSIKVGAYGDRDRSWQLLEAIRAEVR